MISPGTKLGPYEIRSLLGAGGMGEVYRARDPRLGRDVAVKVLPADRMADETRRRRFVQEARAASALNHPNIVTIYDIESANGIAFIVMEYVPGKTLAALIPPQGMGLGELLRVAIPVSDAIARAHTRGIIHRDLKPANVVLGEGGVIKVLDFGLAKLIAADETDEDHRTDTWNSVSDRLSASGMILGTPPYMSPEQVLGGRVDGRSDVFAFGAMLYEMATGRRAFPGNTAVETLAAVVRDQPRAPSEIVPGFPRGLEKLILRCLRKEPERRFQHMGDVKVELLEIQEESNSKGAAPTTAARNRWVRRLAIAATVLLVAVVAVLLARQVGKEPPPAPRVVSLTSMSGYEGSPTFSPDGNQVAFEWDGEKSDNLDIWLTMIGSWEMRRLTSDPAEDSTPAWSPDGRLIAFCRSREGDPGSTIHLLSPLGGLDRKLGDFPSRCSQLSWSPDSQWLATSRARSENETTPQSGALYLIPVAGGPARPITSPEPPSYDTEPVFSWDGHRLAYASCVRPHGPGAPSRCHIFLIELEPDYRPRGAARRLTRQPVLISGLAWTRDQESLVFGAGITLTLWRLGIGGQRPERIEIAGSRAIGPATVASKDRIAFTQHKSNSDIYRFEAGRPPQVVLASSLDDQNPHLSPDGRRVTFASDRSGDQHSIWLADVDGSNAAQLTRGPGQYQGTPRWSPDGRRITFDSLSEDGHWDIWTIDTDGGSLRRLTEDPGDESMPSWSADGRWIYFSSDREGGPNVWRAPWAGGPAERVTRTGGSLAYESIDGRTLYFSRSYYNSPLQALPLAGGPERQIADCVPPFGFAVSRVGVYHLGCAPQDTPLFLFDVATGRDRLLGRVDKPAMGLTVSSDGRTILYAKRVSEGSDLMLIENFH